jgi:hypothetical protein
MKDTVLLVSMRECVIECLYEFDVVGAVCCVAFITMFAYIHNHVFSSFLSVTITVEGLIIQYTPNSNSHSLTFIQWKCFQAINRRVGEKKYALEVYWVLWHLFIFSDIRYYNRDLRINVFINEAFIEWFNNIFLSLPLLRVVVRSHKRMFSCRLTCYISFTDLFSLCVRVDRVTFIR